MNLKITTDVVKNRKYESSGDKEMIEKEFTL